MLIAQVIVNNSEEVSLAVQGAWQDTWELAFNGTLYKALTNLGLIIAVASLLLWTIQFTKNLIDDQSYRQFGELIWFRLIYTKLTIRKNIFPILRNH
jgi:hypothetical protein